MSTESANAFYDDVESGKITLDFAGIDSDDHRAMMAYAHSFGYDFTEEEILEVLNQNGTTITMEEAEAIAGGMTNKQAEEGGAGAGVAGGVIIGAAAACA